MFKLLRLAAYPAVAFLFFRIGFPDIGATGYMMVTFPLLLAGACAAFFLIKLMDISSHAAQWGLEIAFAAAATLFIGYTLPQRHGISPIMQMSRGQHPTRASARNGMERLGLNPDAAPARHVIRLFPKK